MLENVQRPTIKFVHNARIHGKGLLKPLSFWLSHPKRLISQR